MAVQPSHILHLARRFFGSLRPGPPSPADREWAARYLNRDEWTIWLRMSNPDQRHAVEVARAVEQAVIQRDQAEPGARAEGKSAQRGERGADDIGRWPSPQESGFESVDERRQVMVAAGLLHDSGKTQSGLGTMARVGATLTRPLIKPATVDLWVDGRGPRRSLARYWRHPELGGEALTAAGSHRLVSAWAAEHHKPVAKWTVHTALGQILQECDND